MRKIVALLLLSLCWVACSEEQSPEEKALAAAKEAAAQYYNYLLAGKYEQFLDARVGADSLPADYRRTLYWNPNAVSDENGRFTATFYNNGKESRLHMTAAGITSDGRLLHAK